MVHYKQQHYIGIFKHGEPLPVDVHEGTLAYILTGSKLSPRVYVEDLGWLKPV